MERCAAVWDGVDFTPCFRINYLVRAPVLLVAISATLLFAASLSRLRKPKRTKVDVSALVPATGDTNLTQLEAAVFLSAVAGNLVDGTPVPPKDAGKVVDELAHRPADVRRWDALRLWVRVVGGAAYAAVALADAIVARNWPGLVFPIWVALLAPFKQAPLTPLVTAHLFPSILLFRSTIIRPHTTPLALAPAIVEVVWWAALVSVPYADGLDGLLAGSASRGGTKTGTDLRKHIEEPTSAFSRATYTFILPLLWKHYWKPITLDDIPQLREDDSAASTLASYRVHVAKRDTAYFARQDAKRHRNLALDLITFFRVQLAIQCIWITLFIGLVYLPPTGLRLLLAYIGERAVNPSHAPGHVAVLYVGMMALGQSMGVAALGQALMLGRRVCVRMRAIIIAEAFAKALRRQDVAGDTKQASEGKIANIVSTDAFQVSEICAYIFYLFSSPLAITLNSVLLYNVLGVASLAGIAMLVLTVPLQALIGRLYTLFQRRLMAATDARLDAVTEIISHIKLIKFNAWEAKFFERMAATRTRELHALAQRFALVTFSNIIIWGTPVFVTTAAFAVHVLVLKQPLTADRAFSSLVLFNMLRDPMGLLQDTVTRLLQAYTSCGRIQQFLDEPDTDKYAQLTAPGPSDPPIGFRDAVIGYVATAKEGETPFRLGPLDLAIPKGQLSLVTGPVGCGKTTLILSLLGETTLLSGKIFMPDDRANRELLPVDASGLRDSVAYCAQTAWLVGASIKDNILFGSAYDAARYRAVIDACALRRDFEIFEAGDETEVGEKGTTCSGGQKARIALARAVYSSARTLVLDDVLSAVDAQTARHLYTKVLQGPLMRNRTCILVTHAVNLVLPAAAYVVALDAGRVVAAGTPTELSASGVLKVETGKDTPSSSSLSDADSETVHDIVEEVYHDDQEALEAKKQRDADRAAPEAAKLAKQLVKTETSGSGAISPNTYLLYFKSMGGFVYWAFLAIAFVATQLLQVTNNAWIKDWANSNTYKDALVAHLAEPRSAQYYFVVYVAISGVYLFGIACRVGISFVGSLHASRKLYNGMLRRILGARIRFFDSTPSGRIINRLSKDMSSIDSEATEILAYFANTVLSCLAVLAVVVFSTPTFLFALVAIIGLYYVVGTLYVATSRELKRLDSITRSPLFISFSEALVGMSTIRSYADSARFIHKLLHELDTNTRCFWYLWQANRVLNNFSNFVGTFVTVSACVLALRSPNMSAGAAGFSITYALSFTEFVLWVVRLYAASEMSMNSVERVAEYLELDVEEEEHSKGIEPPAYWPSREGSVVVEDLTCKYAPELEPVLDKVSFTIGPKEKIGICGRTGSGKSTLALCFFRLLHQAGGRIMIDGLDIAKLSLSTLRSRLTILPQGESLSAAASPGVELTPEAQLFSGTVRDNLDPFGQHEDYEVWEALRQCGLAGKTPGPSRIASRAVSRAPSPARKARAVSGAASSGGAAESESGADADADGDAAEGDRTTIRSLDEAVAAGGKNFSQGQRQLLALARGLLKLRSSSFLIMDESTANLDHETDATVQSVLRTGLRDTQMLVIAHRLMTVCGLDKILVLDHGKVVEFGTPHDLLQADGAFRDLCRQSGEEAELLALAKAVHDEKAKPKA